MKNDFSGLDQAFEQMYNFIWREVDGKLDKKEILSLTQKLAKALDFTHFTFAQKVASYSDFHIVMGEAFEAMEDAKEKFASMIKLNISQ